MADKEIDDLTTGGAAAAGDKVHVFRTPNSREAVLGDAAGKSVGTSAGSVAAGDSTVNLTGAQTAAGVKTFSDAPVVPDNSFSLAKLAQGTALTVVTRAANSTGNLGLLSAGANDRILRRVADVLDFGQVTIGMIPDALLTLAKLANASAVSVLGRSANSAGVYADIASSADGQVLRRSGSALAFGAVDLADTDAVTGILPAGNLPASTTSAIGAVEKATDAEVRAATADKNLTADLIETASAEVTITDGTTPTPDWDAGINFVLTMAANRTLQNPTNGQPGTYRRVRVIGNDGTDRTLTFGTQYEGTLPTLTDIDNVKQYCLFIHCITATHFIVSSQNATVA